MTQPLDAERVLEHARHDERFAAQLRGAYRGRHDVLDALWWAAHPLTAAPSGVADPALELKELQRAAFSRAAEESQVRENEHRLRDAQHLLAEDTQYLADALSSVEQDNESHEEPPPPNDESDWASPTRRKLLLPVLTGVILLGAILVLPSLSQLNAGADPAPPAPARPSDRVHTDIITIGAEGNVSDPLAVLERPQAAADQPAGELRFDADSYRTLPDLVPHVKLYLAQGNQPDTVCLVVMGAETEMMSTCLAATEFTDGELQLARGRYQVNSEMTILTESYSLLPTGDFRYAATARVTGELASPGTGSVVWSNLD